MIPFNTQFFKMSFTTIQIALRLVLSEFTVLEQCLKVWFDCQADVTLAVFEWQRLKDASSVRRQPHRGKVGISTSLWNPGFRLSLCSCLCVWLGLSPAVFLLRLSGRDNNTCRGEKTRGSTVKNKQKTTHCACESATVAPLQPKQDIFKIQPELPAYRKEK